MKALIVSFAVLWALPLGGCQSLRPVQSLSPIDAALLADLEASSIEEAVDQGRTLAVGYLQKASEAKRRRNQINLAIWLGQTATTLLAGIDVHPETIFIVSSTTQGISALEPITNHGGVEAPSSAIASTRCVARWGENALHTDVQTARLLVETYGSNEDALAVERFDTIKDHMVDRYVGIYSTYLSASTAPPLDVSGLAGSIPKAGAPAPVAAALDPNAAYTSADIQAAVIVLNITTDRILSEIQNC